MLRLRTLAILGLLALPVSPAVAQQVVTMDELTLDPSSFVGKQVTIGECLLLALNDVIGGQCTSVPMSSRQLAYIDVDTWTEATRALLYGCPLTDIMNLCVLEVTGTVKTNSAGQAVIVDAQVTELRRAPAF